MYGHVISILLSIPKQDDGACSIKTSQDSGGGLAAGHLPPQMHQQQDRIPEDVEDRHKADVVHTDFARASGAVIME